MVCADQVGVLLEREPEAVLLLPAGRTPVPLFQELVRRQVRREINLSQAHLFQLDELVGVAPDDPRSFQCFLRDNLIEPARLPETRLNLLDGCAPDLVSEIEGHAANLRALGGGHLAILGVGRSGHVAFNEPGSTRKSIARLVELTEATRTGMRGSFSEPELPTTGITLGIAELYACELVSLIATGSAKAAVLNQLLRGPASSDLPASLFRDHPDFIVASDTEARSAAGTSNDSEVLHPE